MIETAVVKQFPEGCNLQRKRAFCRALVPKQKSQKCQNKNKAGLKKEKWIETAGQRRARYDITRKTKTNSTGKWHYRHRPCHTKQTMTRLA